MNTLKNSLKKVSSQTTAQCRTRWMHNLKSFLNCCPKNFETERLKAFLVKFHIVEILIPFNNRFLEKIPAVKKKKRFSQRKCKTSNYRKRTRKLKPTKKLLLLQMIFLNFKIAKIWTKINSENSISSTKLFWDLLMLPKVYIKFNKNRNLNFLQWKWVNWTKLSKMKLSFAKNHSNAFKSGNIAF